MKLPSRSDSSDQADPRFARMVLAGLLAAVVLCLLVLLLVTALGDDVIHS